MFEAIGSATADLTLEEVLARLSRHPVVEAVLTLGSTRTGAMAAQSDYDLPVVLSERPVRLHVLLICVDGRLTDVLFADGDLITRILAGGCVPGSAYEGILAEHLKAGGLVHDRDARLASAQVVLAGRDWRLVPDDREVYANAVHGINFNYRQNRRYLAYGDRKHRTALEIRQRTETPELSGTEIAPRQAAADGSEGHPVLRR